jgi:hypothetical protein
VPDVIVDVSKTLVIYGHASMPVRHVVLYLSLGLLRIKLCTENEVAPLTQRFTWTSYSSLPLVASQ